MFDSDVTEGAMDVSVSQIKDLWQHFKDQHALNSVPTRLITINYLINLGKRFCFFAYLPK